MKATRRNAKRLLAILMTLAMTISMVNVPVFAAPIEAAKTNAETVNVDGKDYSYTVTLPAGYDSADTKRNYPTIYIMPDNGLSGNADLFTTAMNNALGTSDIMDAIIVKPAFQEGCDVYKVVDAIVKEVDKKYHTVAESSARAVIGTKIGGYLATMLTYTVYEEDKIVSPGNATNPKSVKWNGKPNLFGMMASIHGDYVSEANIWKDIYGDFYNIVSNNGASKGNLSTSVTGRFYTYMDSAAEDPIAYADHGANDIISYYINNGGMYYGGAYTTSSYVIELTAKGSAYTDAFVQKSVSEAIHGFGNKLTQNMVTGSVVLKPQAAYASETSIQALYDIGISNLYTKYCGDVENDLKITISMTDPDTGEKVAEDKTVTIKVKETAKDSSYKNTETPISLPNKVNNVSTTVTLSVEILGKTIELESKPLVRIASTGSEPENQLIDLLGQWHFKAFKNFGEEFQVGIENLPKAEAYSNWEEVYPCLGWWDNNHATSEQMKYYSGYAWYIKEFDIPASFPEGNYVVPVGFFDETDICFINGVQIGCTGLDETTWVHKEDCWDTERIYSIDSSELNIGGKNVMYVLTHNQSGDGGWYNGHPGLYSTAAYNKMTSKPSVVASEADASIVKAAVSAQTNAIIAKDIDAYAESIDPEYFQSGKTKKMLLEEVSGYMEGDGGITVTDKDVYVFQSGDLFYYQASRTVKKADGKQITLDVADYYKIEDESAILYGLHDRFFNQAIPSEYRAKALKSTEKYEDENFLVYLPEGYFENPDKRYPTAYVFHQLNSSSNSYAIDGINNYMDEGINSGAIRDTILVIPDSTGDSWWRNDWASMVTEEIMPYVDSHYRTIQDARYRFTAGASMGGSGSYNIGLTNPNLFSGIISFFGAINMGANPLNIALAQSDEYLEYYTHYLICGNRDLYKFGVPALTLDKKLRTTKAKHYVEIEEGEHDSSFYLPYMIAAFKYQTEDMPSISAEEASQVVSKGRISRCSVRAGEAKVKAEITVTDKVKDYLNTVPASVYTKNTAPELTIPVTLTISKDGKIVVAETKLIKAKEAVEKSLSFDVKSTDLTASGKYDIKVTASVMDQTIEAVSSDLAENSVVESVTVNTTVKPLGQTMDSFEIKIKDNAAFAALAGLTKADFVFSGKASAWGTDDLHEMEGVTITGISVKDDVLTLTLSGVTDRHIYVDSYTVTCTNPALSFTNAQVSETITPVADEFEKVRKANGAEFDYNIYSPANAEKALPVVVAFHGYGDNENLYQNQLAVTWAAAENQEKWPCYVIAPVVENYISADYRNDLYEKTYNLIQKMVKENKIDGDRIYVVGKSFGGLATYEFLEKYPDDIAGAIAMCGAAGYSQTVLKDAAKMKDIPLWIAHAASDDTVNISNSRELHQALVDAGSKAVKFKEYTDAEMNDAGVDGKVVGYHTVELPVLADKAYREWLFAQNKKSRSQEKDAEIAQEAAKAAEGKLPAEIAEGTALPMTTEEGAAIAWSTNNAGVTIGADGKVVVADTVTKDVEVTFTATVNYNGQTATITKTVTVKGKAESVKPITVEKITLNKNKVTLGVKETFKLTATITPSNAMNEEVTWKSSNMKVATVTNGKITAKKKGTAKITATAGGKSVDCTVTVKEAPKKITVTPKSKTIKKGASYTLKVKLPKNTASNKITFTSKNKKVATVSANGKVKGIKKGKTTITIKTFNNKKATVSVTVK